MMNRSYAYGVMVKGQKRFGGTVHAGSMEAAVRIIARRDKLTISQSPPVFRPCDGSLIPQAKWLLEGEPASVYVWAPPEYFVQEFPDVSI